MNTTTSKPEPSTPDQQETRAQHEARAQDRRPLYRPVNDRMLAGVAAGAARYLGVDVTVVRIVLAVLAVMGGAGVPIYLAGWLLIPDEGAEQSIATEFIRSLQARSS